MFERIYLLDSFLIILNIEILMQEVCQQSIKNKDYTTLKEILLKFAYFTELQCQLEDLQFEAIVANVQFEIILRHEPIHLDSNNAYFFLQRGSIYRKEQSAKSQKSIRLKEKTRTFLTGTKNSSRLPQIKQPFSFQIEQYDSFEDNANISSKYTQYIYYSHTTRPTTALFLPCNNLTEELKTRIKNISIQKFKFLVDCGQLKNAQRQFIMEYLHKFQFLHLHFGQTLFSRRVRPQYVVFLKKGLVEVLQTGKVTYKSVLNAKSTLGMSECLGETARCISQKVQCYYIKREDLNTLIFKHRQKTETIQMNTKYCNTYCKTVPMTPLRVDEDGQLPLHKNDSVLDVRATSWVGQETMSKRRNCHKSMSNLKEDQKSGRFFKLRQHFSNFYNQIFSDFSERKIKQMGLKIDNKQNLALYNIKVLQKKAPDMDEIKQRLKRMRIEKMKRCKDQLQRRGHILDPQQRQEALVQQIK